MFINGRKWYSINASGENNNNITAAKSSNIYMGTLYAQKWNSLPCRLLHKRHHKDTEIVQHLNTNCES